MTLSPVLTFNDGNTIPQLGYGVWQVEDDVAEKVVVQAFEAGFRHIDTAKIYGNEAGVGRAIERSGLKPEDIFITTKLWNADQGYESTLKAFEESMDRLGLETLDMYLIHWMQPKQDKYVDTWKALIELQKQGRVKTIGVSNFTKEGLQRLIDETGVVPAINQIELHPFFNQSELREFHASKGILTQAWSPLGQGGELLESAVIGQIAAKHTPPRRRLSSPGTWPSATSSSRNPSPNPASARTTPRWMSAWTRPTCRPSTAWTTRRRAPAASAPTRQSPTSPEPTRRTPAKPAARTSSRAFIRTGWGPLLPVTRNTPAVRAQAALAVLPHRHRVDDGPAVLVGRPAAGEAFGVAQRRRRSRCGCARSPCPGCVTSKYLVGFHELSVLPASDTSGSSVRRVAKPQHPFPGEVRGARRPGSGPGLTAAPGRLPARAVSGRP